MAKSKFSPEKLGNDFLTADGVRVMVGTTIYYANKNKVKEVTVTWIEAVEDEDQCFQHIGLDDKKYQIVLAHNLYSSRQAAETAVSYFLE